MSVYTVSRSNYQFLYLVNSSTIHHLGMGCLQFEAKVDGVINMQSAWFIIDVNVYPFTEVNGLFMGHTTINDHSYHQVFWGDAPDASIFVLSS